MMPFLRFMLVVVAAVSILIDSSSPVAAQEASLSPPGTRRDVIAVLRQWGVLKRNTRVTYVEPFNSRDWLVGLQFADGRKENYSVDTVAKECSHICHD
jgi:hypothetical protein